MSIDGDYTLSPETCALLHVEGYLIRSGRYEIGQDNEAFGRVRRTTEALAFSPYIGGILEFGAAQVGVFAGFDFPSQYVSDNYR
jgi:hypothetical protein